ncbi:MAG: response regulator [Acidobacteria bacterium]|nr:response regulator [Acidobacteriota bacterium]
MRILHLEDDPRDAELVQAMLAAEGLQCEWLRVDTHGDFAAALEQGGFDLILSDFTLPSYDGQAALTLARARRPDIPFIFFSGTIGEDSAVEALKGGATDYVLKQRPARLVASVLRALRETQERAERQRAVEALRQTAAQLQQAQKLETIGQLASGIAHDFNNMLTVMTGFSDLLLQSPDVTDSARENLLEIKRAGKRAAEMTSKLLAFSRKQVLQPRILDLNDVIHNVKGLFQRLLGEDLRIRFHLATPVWFVRADPGQMEQVLMNLAINARDAMAAGGQLTIETANVRLDRAHAGRHHDVRPGPHVMLAVSDTGHGMDAETQARIFEPFFTTKATGQGTGLGLSTVYGIVKQSGGHVSVYSEVGEGTTFKIYLPQVETDAADPTSAAVVKDLPRGTETILLVEDEAPVRNFLRTVLEQLGYTVLEVTNGQEAQFFGERYSGPIQLLLTDVVLPGDNGRQVADRLVSMRPTLKVLYTSGYTENAIVHRGVLDEGMAFLPKPFSPEDLARQVRDVLDG